MTDRNTISQVIESLFEDWIDKNINVHPLAVENMRTLEADALALLKEQEVQKFFVDESGKITPLPVVVRCKDCKHSKPYGTGEGKFLYGCKFGNRLGEGDWFCADGERKSD